MTIDIALNFFSFIFQQMISISAGETLWLASPAIAGTHIHLTVSCTENIEWPIVLKHSNGCVVVCSAPGESFDVFAPAQGIAPAADVTLCGVGDGVCWLQAESAGEFQIVRKFEDMRCQLVPEEFDDVVQRVLKNPSVVAVCGAKNAGKSNMCRFLVNSMLSCGRFAGGVCYLDVDLGQCEFTPPGMLSLVMVDRPLTGSTVENMRLFREKVAVSVFMGDTSQQDRVNEYVRAVSYLVRRFRKDIAPRNVPLVVNCNGWISGMGAEVLLKVLQMCEPTCVVEITKHYPTEDGERKVSKFFAKEDYAFAFSKMEKKPLIVNTPCISDSLPQFLALGAKETRSAQMLAYFEHDKTPVAAQKFHRVPFSAVAVCFAGCDIGPSHALAALNGMIVGLCANPRLETKAGSEGALRFYSDILRPVPCAGLGIVRSIDVEKGEFHIVTPANMEGVNMIVRAPGLSLPDETAAAGFLPLPGNQGFRVVGVPYFADESLTQPTSGAKQMRVAHGLIRNPIFTDARSYRK